MAIKTGLKAADLKEEDIRAVLVTPHLYKDDSSSRQLYSATVRTVTLEADEWVIGLQVRRDDNNGGLFQTRAGEDPPRFTVIWDWAVIGK